MLSFVLRDNELYDVWRTMQGGKLL